MKGKAFWVILAVIIVVLAGGLYYENYLVPKPSFAMGILTADTPSSITIQDSTGKSNVLSVDNYTKVLTQVPAGQAGLELSAIPLHSQVMISLDQHNDTLADSVAVQPAPYMPPQGTVLATTYGTIYSKDGNTIIVQAADKSVVKVVIANESDIVSSVPAGQTAEGLAGLSVGEQVIVYGTRRADGGIDALQVQVQ